MDLASFPWTNGPASPLRRPISSIDLRSPQDAALRRALLSAGKLLSRALERSRPPIRRDLPQRAQAETLLIVPPFASLYIPSLAAHTLQARARRAGHEVDVFYANLHFAALIGEDDYNVIAWEPIGPLAAERIFARCAFPHLPPLGFNANSLFDLERMFGRRQGAIYAASMGLSLESARAAHRSHRGSGRLPLSPG